MGNSDVMQSNTYQLSNGITPLIVITWPRWSGKSFTILQLIELIDKLSIVPQISCREGRADDDSRLLKLINEQDFHQLKSGMLVYASKYWILLEDVNRIIQEWKVPILTLGWKEIYKLQKNWFGNSLFVINITYPLENGKLSEVMISEIMKNRFWNRNWNQEEKEKNLILLIKYMKLFFNNPSFISRFTYTLESNSCTNDLIYRICFLIKQIILPWT